MNYNKKSIEDIDVVGKRVLCRCDFNVPTKNGVITSDKRIVAAMPTIKYLVDHKGELENRVYTVPQEVDQDIARIKLDAMGIKIDTLTEMQQDVQSSISYSGGKKLMDIRKVNYVILGGDNQGEHLLM